MGSGAKYRGYEWNKKFAFLVSGSSGWRDKAWAGSRLALTYGQTYATVGPRRWRRATLQCERALDSVRFSTGHWRAAG